MSTHPTYQTAAVEALPQPWIVRLNVDGNTEDFDAPVVLLQRDAAGATRTVFGIVNRQRGVIEAVDPDNESPGRLGDFMDALPLGEL